MESSYDGLHKKPETHKSTVRIHAVTPAESISIHHL